MVMIDFSNKSLKESLELVERELIKDKLIKTGWNQAQAAAELEMSRTTMNKKIKEYGITR